jgi:RHS repeat-associated protein
MFMERRGCIIQRFNTDNANQLLGVSRLNDVLTAAGSVNTNTVPLSINGASATIYNDLTYAVSGGITISNGLNLITAVANGNLTNREVAFLPVTQTIANDANGNLVSDGLHHYDYDAANELVRVTVTNILKAEFTYDGLGRRRIRTDYVWNFASGWVWTNEVHYVYDGMRVIQERDTNNVPRVTYTRGLDMSGSMEGAGGIGGLLARTEGGNSAYYHCDGNGNITMLVSNNGVVLAHYLYDPSGNPLGMWGSLAMTNTYRFSSMETYDPAGMVLYTYRVYFPNLQRWGQRDPIGEIGGINLYGFVGNNVVGYIDIYGLQPPCEELERDSKEQRTPEQLEFEFEMEKNAEEMDKKYEPLSPLTEQELKQGPIMRPLIPRVSPPATTVPPKPVQQPAPPPPCPQNSGGGITSANSPPRLAISPYRQTKPGEIFFHYGYGNQAPFFLTGLRPGGFATSNPNLTGPQAQQGLALPRPIAPDSVYKVTPTPGTWVRANPVTDPAFGQPGGLPEYQFPGGTSPGTISGPTPIKQ